MAAGVLSEPGTEFGPCPKPCSHGDCAASRQMAESVCRLCNEAIGYGRRFYQESRPGVSSLDLATWVHASCLEDSIGGGR